MKKIFSLIICVFSCLMITSCTGFNRKMLQPEHNPVTHKLPKLDVQSSDNKLAFNLNQEETGSGFYLRALTLEMEENMMQSTGEVSGTVNMQILEDQHKNSYIWTGLNIITLGCSGLIGMPIISTQQHLLVEISIEDLMGSKLSKYRLEKDYNAWLGIYYGHDFADINYLKVFVFKELLKDFRNQIQSDSIHLAERLSVQR